MATSTITSSPRIRRLGRGFTLIEAAMVTVIIGVGAVAMLQLLAVGTNANNDAAELTTGLHLARNIRELSLGLHFADPIHEYTWDYYNPPGWGPESGENLATIDDLDDLDGAFFSPPIDARRQTLANYTGWTQRIRVRSVDPDLLTSPVPNGTSPALRITVTIARNGRHVCDLSWITCVAVQ